MKPFIYLSLAVLETRVPRAVGQGGRRRCLVPYVPDVAGHGIPIRLRVRAEGLDVPHRRWR